MWLMLACMSAELSGRKKKLIFEKINKKIYTKIRKEGNLSTQGKVSFYAQSGNCGL
jgi:hypothetical protein